MDTQNTPITPENLIEDLEDEQLAACVGGCGWYIQYGGKAYQGEPSTVTDNRGASSTVFTLYWMEKGNQIGNKVIDVKDGDLARAGIYYDSNPTGSARFWSDRTIKEAFTEVDAQQVLEKVAALPITTWKYTQESDSVRHIGPMAQDFAATFGVGDSDRSIHVVDANGVTLAAIQGLYQLLQERDAELDHLKAEMQALKQQLHVAA